MASANERQRWERWYDTVMARVNNQKKSIDRLVIINTETIAALAEIANARPGIDWAAPEAQKRAREALDRVEAMAAATVAEVGELSKDPIPDPRPGGSRNG